MKTSALIFIPLTDSFHGKRKFWLRNSGHGKNIRINNVKRDIDKHTLDFNIEIFYNETQFDNILIIKRINK